MLCPAYVVQNFSPTKMDKQLCKIADTSYGTYMKLRELKPTSTSPSNQHSFAFHRYIGVTLYDCQL